MGEHSWLPAQACFQQTVPKKRDPPQKSGLVTVCAKR